MLVLITYDVNTMDDAGKRRLRLVAKQVQPDLRGLTGKIAVVPANQAKFGEREWKPFGYHNNGA